MGKKLLMICGDYCEDYETMVPFQGQARPVAIWCAADREQAWHRFMLQGDASMLSVASACDHPVDRNLALSAGRCRLPLPGRTRCP